MNLIVKILLIGLFILTCIILYYIFRDRPRENLEIERKVKDTYICAWLDKFDVNSSVVESFNINDSIVVFTKGNYHIAFIVNYHHMHPEKYLEQILFKYNDCFVVILDGEPSHLEHLQLQDTDIVISTKHDFLPPKGKIIYMPYYAYWLDMEKNISPKLLIKPSNWKSPPKTKFCVFAYSNCEKIFKGVKDREDFYLLMQNLSGGRVDNLGKCLNTGTQKGSVRENDSVFLPYKFAIVFENDQISGYVSEKIVNAMLSGCIPIYFGAPDVSEHFNKNSFINVADFDSFQKCAEYVLKVDQNEELSKNILKQPWLNDNKWTADKFFVNLNEKIYENSNIPMFLPVPKTTKIIFQTFADGKIYTTQRIKSEAKKSNYFEEIHTAVLNDLDPNFIKKHQNFIDNNPRGYGYWIWKPQIIYERLKMMDDDNILIWADSGCIVQSGSPHMVSRYASQARPILAFSQPFKTGNWTKMDSVLYFFKEGIDKFMNTNQCAGGIIVFRKCSTTMEFVKKWRDACEVYHNIDDSPSINPNISTFEEHRHDQSIFNILCKLYNIPEESDYSNDVDNLLLKDGLNRPFVPARKK